MKFHSEWRLAIACWLILCSTGWFFEEARAQGQQKYPPPVEPYIKTLPSSISWSVTLLTKPTLDEGGQVRNQVVRTHTTLHDAARREIQTWSNGGTTQRWIYQGMALLEQPNVPGVAILRGHREVDEFSALRWISPEHYHGVRIHENRPCYVFQRSQTPPTGSGKAKPQDEQVWIEIATGRPLLWKAGDALWLFQFAPVPNQPLVLPPNFQQALERYLKALRAPEKHRMKF